MIKTFTNDSRRYFLERLIISSAVLVATPNLLLANNSSKMLRISILEEDSELAKIIEKFDKITITKDFKIADVIYIRESHQNSQKYIMEAIALGKHLMIEGHSNNEPLVASCKKVGGLLIIVERSTDDSKLFAKADFYQFETSKSIDYHKILELLSFLSNHTKPMKLKIKTGEISEQKTIL